MDAGFLGILMLETRFPRPPGDVGNPETFARAGIPVRYAVVRGATPRRIVREADDSRFEAFAEAARGFVAEGARLVSTSCGFLAREQARLQRVLTVPLITSSLLQCRDFARPGIVTIDAAALDAAVLGGAGVAPGTPVEGVEPGCEFQRRLLGDEPELDTEQARRDVVAAALRLVERHPQVRDIVLECTNMPPYRTAVAAATGRRVHDIETLLIARWRMLQSKTTT